MNFLFYFIMLRLTLILLSVLGALGQELDNFNNSTSDRKLCCNANQITILFFSTLIIGLVLFGCLIYYCPKFKRNQMTIEYDEII